MQKRTRRAKAPPVPLGEFCRGTDENNLAEFPLALLSDRAPRSQKTIEFQDTLKDWKTGQTITRRVCITGSDKFGLPTAKDEQVLTSLMQLTDIANGLTNPEVPFTKHQVIELLGWPNRGWAYDRIEESLHRWKGVSVHYWNAWRDHANGAWTDTEAIGIIDYFRLTDGRRTRGTDQRDSQSKFIWNRALFESFQAGYLKPLDFGIYRSLKHSAARRAFRFLDKRFWHQTTWNFDLRVFACEKLGFSRNYDTGQLKERLQPAMRELEQIGFIEPVAYHKARPKYWTISISKKETPAAEPLQPRTIPATHLTQQLVERGVSVAVADELVTTGPSERVQEKLKFFDWLMARRDKRLSTNAPGFLVAAVRKDYPLPKDYLKSQAKSNVQQPTSLPKPITPAAPTKDKVIEDYLSKLTVEERASLETAALTAADPISAGGYRRSQQTGGQSFAAYQRVVLERYIRQLLASPKAVA